MAADWDNQLVSVLRALIREEVERATAGRDRVRPLSQAESPLGRRRHIAAARRHIEENTGNAWQVGRTYYVTGEAIEEELRLLSSPSSARSQEDVALDEELGIIDRTRD